MGKPQQKSKSTPLPPANAATSILPPAQPSVPAPAADDATAPQPTEPEKTRSQPPPQDFPSFYLSAATAAFADDLEKLRLAGDFKDASVPILIEALGQGAEIYGDGDRTVWMGR